MHTPTHANTHTLKHARAHTHTHKHIHMHLHTYPHCSLSPLPTPARFLLLSRCRLLLFSLSITHNTHVGENARLLTVPQQHHVVLDPHTPHAAPHAPQQCEHQHDALSRPALSHTQPHTPRHANIDTRHITETSNQSLEELTAKFLALEEQYNTNILRQTKRLIVFPTSMQSPIFPTPLPPPQQDGNTPQLRGAKSQFDKSAVDVSESSPRPQSRGARPHFEGMPFHYSSRHGMTRDTSRQLDRDTSVYSNACYNPIGILDSPYEKRVVHAGSLGALFAADNPVKDVGTAQTQRVEGEQRGGCKEGIESQAAAAVDATAGGIVAVDNNENDKGASRRVYSQFAANGRGNFRGCDNANLREQLLAHGRKIMIDNHTLKTHSCYQDSQILDLNLTLEVHMAVCALPHTRTHAHTNAHSCVLWLCSLFPLSINVWPKARGV